MEFISGKIDQFRCLSLCRWAAIGLTAVLISGFLFGQTADERIVKAVYLERFTRFVDWPAATDVEDSGGYFVMGVVGRNPFEKILYDIYRQQKIKGKPVKIIEIRDLNQLESCHLLYIAPTAHNSLKEIIRRTEGKPILLIGDSPGYADNRVHINMIDHHGHIHFEINEIAARKANLYISYLLLQQAYKIIGTEDQ